jgi:hypothetical protein
MFAVVRSSLLNLLYIGYIVHKVPSVAFCPSDVAGVQAVAR